MMSEEQSEIVKVVYSRFIENENQDWTDLDENLELFGYLTNKELITESKVKLLNHLNGTFRCKNDHDVNKCFAPYVLDAVAAITELYDKTGELHPKNAYVVTYYLVMSEMGLIYSQP